jgi:beta-lactamase class A
MRKPWVVPTTLVVLSVLTLAATRAAPEAPPIGSFTLPAPDPAFQARLTALLNEAPYRRLIAQKRLSVALVDLTDPDHIRYAQADADRMRYAASLPKIGILLGVFDQVDRGKIEYTPALRSRLELMIRNSDNNTASDMIRLVGFQNIARTLQDPRFELYDRNRKGGIWVGRGFGNGVGLWRRDPVFNISHGATARQTARFFVMVERGELVSPWASAEMKSILGEPKIHHKFVLGLEGSHPDSRIYRKSGTWQNYHADAALVERDGHKYVAVALLESPTTSSQGVFASLIVRLDDLVFQTPRTQAAAVPQALSR